MDKMSWPFCEEWPWVLELLSILALIGYINSQEFLHIPDWVLCRWGQHQGCECPTWGPDYWTSQGTACGWPHTDTLPCARSTMCPWGWWSRPQTPTAAIRIAALCTAWRRNRWAPLTRNIPRSWAPATVGFATPWSWWASGTRLSPTSLPPPRFLRHHHGNGTCQNLTAED